MYCFHLSLHNDSGIIIPTPHVVKAKRLLEALFQVYDSIKPYLSSCDYVYLVINKAEYTRIYLNDITDEYSFIDRYHHVTEYHYL